MTRNRMDHSYELLLLWHGSTIEISSLSLMYLNLKLFNKQESLQGYIYNTEYASLIRFIICILLKN